MRDLELQEQSEERLHLLVDGVKEYAIYMLNVSGFVTTWNVGAERIKGYQPQEIIGQHYSVFFAAEDRQAGAPEQILAVAKHEGRYQGIGTRIRKDGTRFIADVVITALYDAQGELRGFGKVTRDITDRVRQEQEVEQASRRKDEFLAMLAHELRNPMAPIVNCLGLLDKDASVPARAREDLKVIERQTRHLVRLLDDLLDIARISTGKLSIRRSRLNVRDVVDLAVESARPFITKREHALHLEIAHDAMPVNGDIARLSQLLANLLHNAAKFTDPGGNIWLRATREAGSVVLSVRDDGIGIPATSLPHLFERFYQVAQPAGGASPGMGIGLSLAYELARLHDGSIEARSGGSGQGSEFTVRLPASMEEERPPAPARSAPQGPARRFLVVDDHADAGDSLAAVLRLSGHEALAVASADAALNIVESFHPDVMIIDIAMPDMNGNELARRVRRLAPLRNIRLIAVTGYGQEQDRERSRQAGFDVHLVKPVNMDELRNAIAGASEGFAADRVVGVSLPPS